MTDPLRWAVVAPVVSLPTVAGSGSSTPVVAHQGGWDEILMVVGPLAVIGLLLWRANRRVNAELEQAATEAAGDDDETQMTGGDGTG